MDKQNARLHHRFDRRIAETVNEPVDGSQIAEGLNEATTDMHQIFTVPRTQYKAVADFLEAEQARVEEAFKLRFGEVLSPGQIGGLTMVFGYGLIANQVDYAMEDFHPITRSAYLKTFLDVQQFHTMTGTLIHANDQGQVEDPEEMLANGQKATKVLFDGGMPLSFQNIVEAAAKGTCAGCGKQHGEGHDHADDNDAAEDEIAALDAKIEAAQVIVDALRKYGDLVGVEAPSSEKAQALVDQLKAQRAKMVASVEEVPAATDGPEIPEDHPVFGLLGALGVPREAILDAIKEAGTNGGVGVIDIRVGKKAD